jgi:mannose-6-phosphate isomerase-like protein (cupin superfamily)
MEKFRLEDMVKGWFVGDFEPTVITTKDCEVGVKHYTAGTKEDAHYHKQAEELTVVISGRVRMNDSIFEMGDIVKVLKDEVIEFEALEDTITVVYKTKSVQNDKFLIK